MLRQEYRIDEPRRGFRKSLLLLLGLVVVIVLVMVIYYLTKLNRSAADESREVKFTVARGSNTTGIATALDDQEIINSKLIFLIYSQLHGVSGKIQAGEYSLNSNMTIPEIVDILTAGKVVSDMRSVTVIEGWSNAQIGKYLASRKITTADSDFEKALSFSGFDFKFKTTASKFNYQGFMFPDTYALSKTATVDDLIQKMLKNFETKITDQMISDIENSGHNLGQALTLASIVEKEVGRNKTTLTKEDLAEMQTERELVASVFYNRLEIGMPLESDATVNFITGKADRSVTIEDTKIKSPYNTYQVRGLPPTPISNPGIGSIRAAIYPAHSDYLFFLNAPDGKAYFAKTLAEHNANRAKYLR